MNVVAKFVWMNPQIHGHGPAPFNWEDASVQPMVSRWSAVVHKLDHARGHDPLLTWSMTRVLEPCGMAASLARTVNGMW